MITLKSKPKQGESELLIEEIKKTRSKIKSAESAFRNTTDPTLINSCIYELKALDLRHSYLIEKVKREVN